MNDLPPDPRARVAKRTRESNYDPNEQLNRTRRIETRVTQIALALGIRTDAQHPEFEVIAGHGTLTLPSLHSSMREILDNIPKTWDGPVKVFIGDEPLITIDRSGGL